MEETKITCDEVRQMDRGDWWNYDNGICCREDVRDVILDIQQTEKLDFEDGAFDKLVDKFWNDILTNLEIDTENFILYTENNVKILTEMGFKEDELDSYYNTDEIVWFPNEYEIFRLFVRDNEIYVSYNSNENFPIAEYFRKENLGK